MKLKKYSGSDLMSISIKYQGEKFNFNLFEELKINQDKLQMELKTQPSYYGFLLMLHKKLLTQFEDLKLARKKIRGELFLEAKSSTNGGRPMNDEMCKSWVESNKKYMQATKACIKAKDDADVIYAAVKAFEQRKDLLQTISSNSRAESFT